MEFILQLLYALIGVGATVLDFYIYQAFEPDVHHSVYITISSYSDKGEGVALFFALIIGFVAESGAIKTASIKTCVATLCTILFVVFIIESLVRVTSMTVVSIHVHPGKLDFMGLFVMLVLLYFTLKFAVVMHHMISLIARINAIVVPTEKVQFVPLQMLQLYQPVPTFSQLP